MKDRELRRPYPLRVLIGLDQFVHALFGGSPDETISSALGKRKLERGGKFERWDWLGFARPLDWFLDLVDPNHSIEAIERDEGKPPAG